jgi:hypothetical protein
MLPNCPTRRLTRSRLTRSRLTRSRLTRSRLTRSRLTRSRLTRSRLTSSRPRAESQRANERRANERRANERRANERRANERRANERRANEQRLTAHEYFSVGHSALERLKRLTAHVVRLTRCFSWLTGGGAGLDSLWPLEGVNKKRRRVFRLRRVKKRPAQWRAGVSEASGIKPVSIRAVFRNVSFGLKAVIDNRDIAVAFLAPVARATIYAR